VADIGEPGGSLDDRVRAAGRGLPARFVADVGRHLASSLAATHARGRIHGGVTPQNVLTDDSGFAWLRETGAAQATRYASPEELDGADPTPAGEMYALGATLLHAALGRSADLQERLSGIVTLVAGLPQPLRGVIERCMNLDPARRPLATEVAAELAAQPTTSFGAPVGPPRDPSGPIPVPRPQPVGPPPARTPTPVVDDALSSPRTPLTARTLFIPVVVAILAVAGVVAWIALADDDAPDTESDATTVVTTDVVTTIAITTPVSTAPPAPTSTIVVTTPPPTTAAETTAPPTTEAATTIPETTLPPTNPFGDTVGSSVTTPANAAAAYAHSIQTGGDPAAIAVAHSPAYYFALWARMLGVARPDVAPVVTADGYAIELTSGAVTVSALDPPAGPIERIALATAGVPIDIATGVQPSGVCVPGPDPCSAGLANPQFIIAADAPTGARLVTLATVRVDPARVTMLLFVDLPGVDIEAAAADFAEGDIPIDRALDFVALSYSPGPPPGTIISLRIRFTDGRDALFRVPVV
jgi:hypothetical protein